MRYSSLSVAVAVAVARITPCPEEWHWIMDVARADFGCEL